MGFDICTPPPAFYGFAFHKNKSRRRKLAAHSVEGEAPWFLMQPDGWIAALMFVLSCDYSKADPINPDLSTGHSSNAFSLGTSWGMGVMLRKREHAVS